MTELFVRLRLYLDSRQYYAWVNQANFYIEDFQIPAFIDQHGEMIPCYIDVKNVESCEED